jgi:uncharacterized membrane protein YgcG
VTHILEKTTIVMKPNRGDSVIIRRILPVLWILLLANATSCAATTNTATTDAGTTDTATANSTWPLAIDSTPGRVEIYQPQPDSLTGDKLSARAAVSLLPGGANQPIFGAIWINARLQTDRDARTATLQDIQVKDVRLPEATRAQQEQFTQAIIAQVPKQSITFSLDQLMTSLDLAKMQSAAAKEIRTDPPKILFSSVPATLVSIDGPPRLQQVDQSPLMRVMNTPFLILFDPQSNQYFLKAGAAWVSATNVAGPYEDAAGVPAAVIDVAARLQKPVMASASAPAAAPTTTAPPKIIVATEPSELIVTDGQPQYTPLPGNDLLYVSNTHSDVFLEIPSQQNYVLLSGRWYRSKSLQGPWEYVAADQLPAAFSKISADSPKANVLAFVAGTQEAKDAVLDASIPQTAAVGRDAGTILKVAYDGDPKFEPIQGTSMTYAVNTSQSVIDVKGTYYCCGNAVWYQAPTPDGPWTVCVSVPPEIYTIPPSSPIYNVRYVYVYDYDPDFAYVGYLPGYAGCYVDGPTVVYGTGYDYSGWYGSVYYPGPFTWGFGASFDPWNDSWGFGLGYDWGPTWFWHDRFHHRWFGPGGFRDYRGFGDHRFAEMHGADFDDHYNVYRRLENGHANMFVPRDTGFEHAAWGGENNVFAGHDGSVYRRTDQGWEARQNGGWARMNEVPEIHMPEPVPAYRGPTYSGGLEADHFARERGAFRAGGYSGGGFHGGAFSAGGGFHGGGFSGGGGGGHR